MKKGKPIIIHFDFYDLLIALGLIGLMVMAGIYLALKWRS